MPYIPPVTKEGLEKIIKHWLETDEEFKQFMPLYKKIQSDPKMKAAWDVSMTLAFYAMGGKESK